MSGSHEQPEEELPAGGVAGSVRGFTLLEVLVAVAILSISLASLLSSQMASLRATDQARRLSSVAFLAEGKLVDIEWELKQDGWGTDDQVFDGDFSEEGWPDVEYICVVDLIELPDYQQLVQATEEANTGGATEDGVMDAAEAGFGLLGMVWPIIKEAIEQSIRKSWCTVRWAKDGNRAKLSDEWTCEDAEVDCMSVATFWTDPQKLTQLPSLGGEVTSDDVDGSDGDGDDGRGGADGGGDPRTPSTGRPSSGGRPSGGPVAPGLGGGRGGIR